MRRREQVRRACQRCRKKRAKCDGENPCERCQVAGLDCVFDASRRESKNDLRAEVERLRRANEQSSALLDAMSSMEDTASYHTVAKGLMDGTTTRKDLFLRLSNKPRDDSACIASSLSYKPQADILAGASPSASASACAFECLRSTCALCSGPRPLSTSSLGDGDGGSSDRGSTWDPSTDTQSDGCNAITSPTSMSSSLDSVLVFPGPGMNVKHSKSTSPAPLIDGWTRTGWTTGLVLEHIELLITWDYLPFCLLCKDPFLQDLEKGTGQFCSSALVNALLALATRMMNEQKEQRRRRRRDPSLGANTDVIPPSSPSSAPAQDWTDSQTFWNEAETLMKGQHSSSLPDAQALGIMALYQVSSGRLTEARELANAFAAAATDLCSRPPSAEEQQGEYARVRATTYCGAISLVRILKLTTAQPSGLHAAMLQDDGITLDELPHTGAPDGNGATLPSLPQRHNRRCGATVEREAWWHTGLPATPNPGSVAEVQQRLQLGGLQIIPAKLFQLTEWLYKLLALRGNASAEHVVSVYRQCLNWYESLFVLFRSDESKSPFILFIHIYYQFCLLSLFRPFNDADLEVFNVYPRDICVQAAHSILVLTQSYARLYGLWRVSPLMPYFVCASGLLSIAAEKARHSILKAVPMATVDINDVRPAELPLPVESLEAAVKTNTGNDSVDLDVGYGLAREWGQYQQHQKLRSPAHIKMPAIIHALLLLEKMSSLHPVAAAVAGMLHRASDSI